jgi:hypothetical protein
MKLLIKFCLVILMTALFIGCNAFSLADSNRLQNNIAPWLSADNNKIPVEIKKTGRFDVSAGQVIPEKDGAHLYTVDFSFATRPLSMTYQAEDAKFENSYVLIEDTYGQRVVNALGDTTQDRLTFSNVDRTNQLNFYYAQWEDFPLQFSLYINGIDTATLSFEPTGNGYRTYRFLSWKNEKPVEGEIRLQIDEDDAKANKGKSFMIDYMTPGILPQPQDSQITLKMPLPKTIDSTTQSISLLMRGTIVPLDLILVDKAGKQYQSIAFQVDKNQWERVTVLFEDFEPALLQEKISELTQLEVHINGNGIADKGRFEIKDILLSAGWPSTPPKNCPFKASEKFAGISFTGKHITYGGGDTWYPSWADDDKMYSSFTDGTCDGIESHSWGADALTGHAVISGSDPMNLKIQALGVAPASPLPYGGRYPCGGLVYNGIWYYGTYTLTDAMLPCGNWCTLGPMCGYRISNDYGKTWTDSPHTPAKGGLFGEQGTLCEQKVKIGSPHFVDFGKNMQYSPDGKAYIIAHGAVRPDAKNTWVSGDQIYMARVTPTPKTINDPNAWEFFAGHNDKGKAVWSKKFGDTKPLFEWNDNAGCVTMTWMEPLKKYITCVTWGWPTIGKFDTYLLESDNITGPFKLITYMDNFGEQAYFVNIPSKFISSDGSTFWLASSANFTKHTPTPRKGTYAFSLHEVLLIKTTK